VVYLHTGSDVKRHQYGYLFGELDLQVAPLPAEVPDKLEPQVEGCGAEAERVLVATPLDAVAELVERRRWYGEAPPGDFPATRSSTGSSSLTAPRAPWRASTRTPSCGTTTVTAASRPRPHRSEHPPGMGLTSATDRRADLTGAGSDRRRRTPDEPRT
jgi:hypothetical protein